MDPKLEKIRAYGVDIVLHGSEAGAAELHAQELASSGGLVYVSPYRGLGFMV
jgi:threonine dehydratase